MVNLKLQLDGIDPDEQHWREGLEGLDRDDYLSQDQHYLDRWMENVRERLAASGLQLIEEMPSEKSLIVDGEPGNFADFKKVMHKHERLLIIRDNQEMTRAQAA